MAQLMSRYELRGWERGLAEGREQGQAEGREQGQQDLLLQMIAGRWGEADEALLERGRSLTSEQVLALGKALFDFTGKGELENWLRTPPEIRPGYRADGPGHREAQRGS